MTNPCDACDYCCKHVALKMEEPNTPEIQGRYLSFLLHGNVQIFIDVDDNGVEEWNVLFKAPCTKLNKDGWCTIYNTRPQICRDYSSDNCSKNGADHKNIFNTAWEFVHYLGIQIEPNCVEECLYADLEINIPDSKETLDEARWFLIHKDIDLYFDEQGDWFARFYSKCRLYNTENLKDFSCEYEKIWEDKQDFTIVKTEKELRAAYKAIKV